VTKAETPARSDQASAGKQRSLDVIERIGNKVPHPAVLFLALCAAVIVLSALLNLTGWSATYEVVQPPAHSAEQVDIAGSVLPGEMLPAGQAPASSYHLITETAKVQSLLSVDGLRFLFTSFVTNFTGFTAAGIILIVMIGVGVSEVSGLISSLIRKLVAVSSASSLTYVVVLLGIVSSIASDAGYLVLIPLGAAAFKSIGRHPLAGMAAAFAGVAGGFGINLLITPNDAVLTEITNDAIHLVDPTRSIEITANLYFAIGSTLLLTLLLSLVTKRLVEPRLGSYDVALAPSGDELRDQPDLFEGIPSEDDSRGLRWAAIAFLITLAGVLALSIPPGAPLRDPNTGSLIGTSPLMDSLIVIISICFLTAGLGYGRGAGTLKSGTEAIEAITKSWAGLAGMLFLFLLIAQFIAYFNYSEIPQIAAVKLGDVIEHSNVGGIWLLLAVMAITLVIGVIVAPMIAKWALLAPIFIPLFLRLGVQPQTVLAAYRVADSPINVINPIMPYFPLIVMFARRYDRSSGLGTILAMMVPYFLMLTVVWVLFFIVWYLLGIPLGPGAPV
jgi:aminobenzoyl-glutamate transport protein